MRGSHSSGAEAKWPFHPSLTISRFNPTGEATTGTPVARYWISLYPHFPQTQRLSGRGMIPTSNEAMSPGSSSRRQGFRSTGIPGSKGVLFLQDHHVMFPGQPERLPAVYRAGGNGDEPASDSFPFPVSGRLPQSETGARQFATENQDQDLLAVPLCYAQSRQIAVIRSSYSSSETFGTWLTGKPFPPSLPKGLHTNPQSLVHISRQKIDSGRFFVLPSPVDAEGDGLPRPA